MSAISQESPQNPFFSLAHENCAHCLEKGWTPKETGTTCLHRHNELTAYCTDPLFVAIDEYAKNHTTRNAAVLELLFTGLLVKGVLSIKESYAQEELLPKATQGATKAPLCPDDARGPAHPVGNRATRPSGPPSPGPVRREKVSVLAVSGQAPEWLPGAASRPKLPQEAESQNLWSGIRDALEERVSPQNFEIWLSSVRFACANELLVTLQVPTAFFQEYLGEHYVEVIQEELLRKYQLAYQVELVIAIAEEETPALPEPEKEASSEERFASDPIVKQLTRRLIAAQSNDRRGTNQVTVAEITRVQRLYYDRIEQLENIEAQPSEPPLLRVPGDPQLQRQYAKNSPWAPGLAVPSAGQVQKSAEQLERDLKPGKRPTKPDSS